MAHLRLKDTVLSDRRLPLPGRVVVIGRSLETDVPIPHRSVSRRHALIESAGRGFTLSDLGSVNGTFLGERRLVEGERAPLAEGEFFRVGEVRISLAADEMLVDDPLLPGGTPAPAEPEGMATAVMRVPAVGPGVGGAASSAMKPVAKGTGKPRAAVRKTVLERRARSNAMRWVGVIVTVVLLALAGIFASRTLSLRGQREQPAVEEAPEEEEKPARNRDIKPIRAPD